MYRVLLADDEIIIRENVSKHVKWAEHGFELVGSCQNGQEVIDYMAQHPVDLVITDICMPFMDGMELCEHLHEHYPAVKIILLSGYDEFEYAKKAIRYGVVEYVLKPVTAKEMGELLDRVRDILEKERQDTDMKQSYRENYQHLISNTLADFIIGNKSLDESENELKRLNLPLWTHSFRVAVLELNMFATQDIIDRKTQKESSLTAFIVFNVALEVITSEHAGVVCQDSSFHTLILFYNNTGEDCDASNTALCEKIMHHLKETMGLKVTIGLGGNVSNAEEIPRSYSEAKLALQYRYLKGENKIIHYSGTDSRDSSSIDRQYSDALMEAVRNTDEASVEHAIYLIRHSILSNRYKKDEATILLSWTVEMLGDILAKYDLNKEEQKQHTLTAILQAETLEQAMNALTDYSLFCIRTLSENRKYGSKNYVKNALAYVESHYGDCELTLKTICCQLNISVSRFSSLFKTETGETFLEYLTRIRMEHAKDFLLHTDMKNYEIAERVGFADAHYFGIAFKKETGKTPTEYKNEGTAATKERT